MALMGTGRLVASTLIYVEWVSEAVTRVLPREVASHRALLAPGLPGTV